MTSGEQILIDWLSGEARLHDRPDVLLGIGDDMAILQAGGGQVLLTTDMLLDGVHFQADSHDLADIGRKAIGCGLSDCAAMAVRPVAAAVSVALPTGWRLTDSQRLYGGMRDMADAFDCSLVGGDTTGWAQRLAIDVAVIGEPYPGMAPLRRDGAKVGDVLLVTGKLGGSLLGRHLTFTPRVREARIIVEFWGGAAHAMMDVSDGLSLDLHRMCRASNAGAILDQALLADVVHHDAVTASQRDGRSPLEHALSDGEDFELLLAVDPQAAASSPPTPLYRIGTVTDAGFKLRESDGSERDLAPRGFEHLP